MEMPAMNGEHEKLLRDIARQLSDIAGALNSIDKALHEQTGTLQRMMGKSSNNRNVLRVYIIQDE
jgi:hypothetical protein